MAGRSTDHDRVDANRSTPTVSLPWRQPPIANPEILDRVAAHLDRLVATWTTRERTALSGLLTIAAGDGVFAALAAEPANEVLEPDECIALELLHDEQPRDEPASSKPSMTSLVCIMKATRHCNLRCTYCHFWREGPDQVMPFPVLARATRDALAVPGVLHVEFVWHGGEATLLSPAYYRKAVWLQQHFRRPGQRVDNFLQTNGTRLSDDWLAFLRRYRFSVGVSLDGPPELHDRRRLDVAGRPTWARVHVGLARLQSAGIPHGVLLVVDDAVVAAGAARLLSSLVELGVRDVGVLNAIPENTPPDAPVSGTYLRWPRYVEWLRELFGAWFPRLANRIVVRELADLAGQIVGNAPQTCFFAGDCHGRYLTIEPDGEVSACDKYVGDARFRFGHLERESIGSMLTSMPLAELRAENRTAVDRMRTCTWFAVCHGGCPHDRRLNERYVATHDGSCCGLRPLLDDMARALEAAGVPVAARGAREEISISHGRASVDAG